MIKMIMLGIKMVLFKRETHFYKFNFSFLRIALHGDLKASLNCICFISLCSDKYRVSRSDVNVGHILGAGFFGEVHDGFYKSPVSSPVV